MMKKGLLMISLVMLPLKAVLDLKAKVQVLGAFLATFLTYLMSSLVMLWVVGLYEN